MLMAVYEDMESLGAYTKRLEKALVNGKPHTSYNRDTFYAFAILLAMFVHAKREARLFSKTLDLLVYGNPLLLQTVRDFPDKDGKLRILVESEIGKERPLVELVQDSKVSKVSIRRTPAELQSTYK